MHLPGLRTVTLPGQLRAVVARIAEEAGL